MNAAIAGLRLDDALRTARLQRASDIHLAGGLPVLIRLDGTLVEHSPAPVAQSDIDDIVSVVLDERARARLSTAGDVTATYCDTDRARVRVHVYRTNAGYSLAIRMLAEGVPAIEELGLPPVVRALARQRHGLLIFSGPTGSGKSTAMAALINAINCSRACHIVTIEDPVEYAHTANKSLISQRNVGIDVANFHDALAGALRSDPDVILVGEMRDRATISAAITAAETGHLVLATLHTGSSAEAVDRIIGAFSGEMQGQVRLQLAQSLAGVICLRLVPDARGRGRRCAAEILLGSDAVRNVIREAKPHQVRNIIATSRSSGMQTLEDSLNHFAACGEISYEEAVAAANVPAEIKRPVLG